ncbi:MAG: hypothetical protein A2Y39_01000 [Candidatus Delongbacteria bacterium GWF2_40_14]|nr:MAG: hypothetical protein A2Y39_01000 [Candidatus Delongbacteria bacterium GWF2_40_14]
MKMTRPITLLIFFLLTLESSAIDLNKIKYLYESALYPELISYTEGLKSDQGTDTEEALYRGLAYYKMGSFRESKKSFFYVSGHSDNIFIKECALYYLALSKIRLEEKVEGAVIFTGLLNSSQTEISVNSKSVLEALINNRLNEEDLKELNESIFDRTIKKYIIQSRTSLKILAVLPLTGADKDAGNDLLSGLEFAVKKMNRNGRNIKLDVINSESKMPVMVKKVLDRLNSTGYNLIVGELRSDATAALAGLAAVKNIPLVSPTASANNISDISRFVFQMNTTSYSMSKMIAEYAIDSLNYKTFAVIAPASEDGNESVTGFTEKVVEKGCSVLSTEWYYEAYDLNKQIQRIREKILGICSLEIDEYMLPDSIRTFQAPVIDAIFLPVPNSDIESVLSQVSYYNFKANLLGTYGWNDMSMLNKLSANADSLVFISESSYDADNPRFNDFVFFFRKEMNRNPKKLEIIGYALLEMLDSIQRDNPEKSLLQALSEMKEYDSISGKIFLDDKRSNLSADINMYSSKRKILAKTNYQNRPGTNIFEISDRYYNAGYVNEVTCKYSNAADNYLKSLDEFKKTVNLPDSVSDSDPKCVNLNRRLGNTYFMLGDYKIARQYFEKVLNHVKNDKDVEFKNTVAAAGSEDDPEESIKNLMKYITDKNYSSDAYYELGNIFEKQNQEAKAKEYYEKAAKLKNKKAKDALMRLKK